MKPNIVVVMVDQMRADLRKSCGFELDTMPFLDSFGQEGVDFERAYTANPTCMPARVSMFTGRVPSCHNVRTNHNAEDAVYTEDLVDVLKKNGYKTAICGKNHSHLDPEDFDFHETNGHLGADGDMPQNEKEEKFDEYLKTLHFCDSLTASPYSVEEQLPYRNVSSFLRFADKCIEEDRPFFSWVSMAEPHNPYQVPAPYFDMFPPESLPPLKTSVSDLVKKDFKFKFARYTWERVYGKDIENRIARDRSNYLGMLRLIDDQFRRLVDGLKERNIYKNTLVVFLSDHGEFVGEYGVIRKGCGVAELLAHIPMVFGGYEVEKQGKNKQDFVNIIDIFPTICDMIDTPVPFGVQGKSILPILEGKPYNPKEFEIGYSESGFGGLYWNEKDALTPEVEGATKQWDAFDCLNTWSQSGQVRMIRKGDYKFIDDMMGNYQLYNIAEDPLELNDLSHCSEYKDILLDMSLTFNSEILRKADNIPSCKYRYRTKVHPKGYWFDDDFHVERDPGVVYHPVECRKRSR